MSEKKEKIKLSKQTILSVILVVFIGIQFFLYFNLSNSYNTLGNQYNELFQKYSALIETYNKLIKDYNTLLANYTRLFKEYSSLQDEYGILVTNYTNLQTEYRKLETEYATLEAKYDILKSDYKTLEKEYNALDIDFKNLQSEYKTLKSAYDTLNERWNFVLEERPYGYVVSTVVYFVNYGKDMHILSTWISWDADDYYKKQYHPYPNKYNLELLKTYITYDEPIFKQIVREISQYCDEEEELADALLDYVQYKKHALSIRYYCTGEYKYPIETLVEMGGDCDAHAFLYATLMKVAGFKVAILVSDNMEHAMVGVHLSEPPAHCSEENCWYVEYKNTEYYFAETTMWGWKVGDLPEDMRSYRWYVIEI